MTEPHRPLDRNVIFFTRSLPMKFKLGAQEIQIHKRDGIVATIFIDLEKSGGFKLRNYEDMETLARVLTDSVPGAEAARHSGSR